MRVSSCVHKTFLFHALQLLGKLLNALTCFKAFRIFGEEYCCDLQTLSHATKAGPVKGISLYAVRSNQEEGACKNLQTHTNRQSFIFSELCLFFTMQYIFFHPYSLCLLNLNPKKKQAYMLLLAENCRWLTLPRCRHNSCSKNFTTS